MAAAKKLELKFVTDDNKQSTLTLDDPKTDLTEQAVKTAMQAMVDSGVFATSKGAVYQAPYSAAYVERTVTDIFKPAQ
jgi:hypothetical protein